MTITLPEIIAGFVEQEDFCVGQVNGHEIRVTFFLSEGKYGYVAHWMDLVFISPPAYMSMARATSDAISVIEEREDAYA